MKKKIRNLENGEVFEITFPDGKKKHCQFACVDYLKKGKHTVTFHRKDGEPMTLSNDDFVEVIYSGSLPEGVYEAAKKALEEEMKSKQ